MNELESWLEKMNSAHPGWKEWDALLELMSDAKDMTLHTKGDQEYLVNEDAGISVCINGEEILQTTPQGCAWLPLIVEFDCCTPGLGFNTSGKLFGNRLKRLTSRSFGSFFVRTKPPAGALKGLQLSHLQYNRSGGDVFLDQDLNIRIFDPGEQKFAVMGALEDFARYSMHFTLQRDHWHFSYSPNQKQLEEYGLTYVSFT